MEKSLFSYILHYSKRQQVWLTVVIFLYFPIQYLSLELPKMIIDDAIGADGPAPYTLDVVGLLVVDLDVSQLHFLWLLCLAYLALVVLNNAVKYYINVYRGRLGERMLRRLRYQLYDRLLRFPLPHFRKTSPGEIIPMITQEVEPIGGFIGASISEPIYKGGMLLVLLGFMIAQDAILGLAAIAFFPLQMYLIPKLQRRVNALAKRRVREVRRLADQIGENVAGVADILANDTVLYERTRFTRRLGRIYWIRFEIYLRKFFIKFLNNFIDKLTPFFFFAIGGWLVLEGEVTLGALTGVLLAYKDVAAPWKELLAWYQQKEDARIKFEQVVRQFAPDGMREEAKMDGEPPEGFRFDGEIVLQNLRLVEEDGATLLDGINARLPAGGHVAILGDSASGKSELGLILAGLVRPSAGAVTVGGVDLAGLPLSVTGREIAYFAADAPLVSGSLRDNLLYGLKQRPFPRAEADRDAHWARELEEAEAAGNATADPSATWVDWARAGVESDAELGARLGALLRLADLDEDVYQAGLRGAIDPDKRPDVAARILSARRALKDKLREPAYQGLVEPFDAELYNVNASVAENLLYGTPTGEAFRIERIAENPHVRAVLERTGLTDTFLAVGRQVSEIMIELFADLPPGHEFFERFSFIKSDEIGEYQSIVARSADGFDKLDAHERERLLSLPFRLTPGLHRLGLIDEPLQARILEARRVFRETLPEALAGEVAFFEEDAYNPAASLQDNILFGKLVHARAGAAKAIGALISEVIEALGLRDTVIDVGLDSPVGVAGARLAAAQRQKTLLVRALLRRPALLIVNEGLNAVDNAALERILIGVMDERAGEGLVWIGGRGRGIDAFQHVLVLERGHLAGEGSPAKLQSECEPYRRLLAHG